jgi:methylglutaconyl-CoA hydratase
MIKYTLNSETALITLNNSAKKNALNPQLVKELKESLTKANSDNQVKSIIITGEGDAFCAGADLSYLNDIKDNTLIENEKDSKSLAEMFLMVYNSEKPVIAAVEGPAIAGGCGLASVCDFIIAHPEKAKFGYTEVKIGFIPAIVSLFLIRKIGEGKAKELLLTGKLINGSQAKELGFVNQTDENPVQAAFSLAEKINKNSVFSISLTKKMINTISALNIEDAVNYCLRLNTLSRTSNDFAEGLQMFLNKK